MFLAYVYRLPDKWATSEIGEIEPGHYLQIEPVFTFNQASEALKKVNEMRQNGLRKIPDPGRRYESPLVAGLGFKSERDLKKKAFVWMFQFSDERIDLLLFGQGNDPLYQTTVPSLDSATEVLTNYAYAK